MTNARLARVPKPDIDYASLSFNPDDPEPLPEALYQYPILLEILPILGAHLNRLYPRETVFHGSNTFICYDPNNLNVRVGPDFYFAFGVDAPAIEETKLYLPWEVGKPPDFVLEIASESTADHDVTGKRQIYAEIGVPEYWRFDRSGGDYYGASQAGERLVDGIYQPVPLSGEPDGILKGYSPALRLSLCVVNTCATLRRSRPAPTPNRPPGKRSRSAPTPNRPPGKRSRLLGRGPRPGCGSCRKNWNEGTGKAEGSTGTGHILHTLIIAPADGVGLHSLRRPLRY